MTVGSRMGQGRKHGLALALLAGVAAAPAAAAVYEIGDDGAVERLDAAPAPKPPRPNFRYSHGTSVAAQTYRPYVAAASARYEVSPALVDAIAHTESRYNQSAVSRAGASGVMQLMPGTARDLGVDRNNAEANISGGTAYLRLLLNRFDGDVVRTIAAYNAGPGAVAKAGGVPRIPETVAYVSAVLNRLADAAN